MRLIKTFILSVFLITLVSCASANISNNRQEEVKQEVLKLLEKEYKQPFKITNFNVTYESYRSSDTGCAFFFCTPQPKHETYNFEIKAVNNPIINMSFKLKNAEKGSVDDLIDSFKKNQLKERYCSAFASYYLDVMNSLKTIQQPYTNKIEKFCDDKGQTEYRDYKNYYLKHKNEYK